MFFFFNNPEVSKLSLGREKGKLVNLEIFLLHELKSPGTVSPCLDPLFNSRSDIFVCLGAIYHAYGDLCVFHLGNLSWEHGTPLL